MQEPLACSDNGSAGARGGHSKSTWRYVMWIVWALIVGIIAGFLARAVVPGDDSMGLLGTMVLGLVGSVIGGFLGWVLFGRDANEGALQLSGLLGSFIGAVIALLAYRAFTGRSGHHHIA